MGFIEHELEKKTLSELGALVYGYEQKVKELAKKIGYGEAKPADMMAMNADLAMLKRVRDKKMNIQSKMVPQAKPKTAVELKSYEDYVKKHSDK